MTQATEYNVYTQPNFMTLNLSFTLNENIPEFIKKFFFNAFDVENKDEPEHALKVLTQEYISEESLKTIMGMLKPDNSVARTVGMEDKSFINTDESNVVTFNLIRHLRKGDPVDLFKLFDFVYGSIGKVENDLVLGYVVFPYKKTVSVMVFSEEENRFVTKEVGMCYSKVEYSDAGWKKVTYPIHEQHYVNDLDLTWLLNYHEAISMEITNLQKKKDVELDKLHEEHQEALEKVFNPLDITDVEFKGMTEHEEVKQDVDIPDQVQEKPQVSSGVVLDKESEVQTGSTDIPMQENIQDIINELNKQWKGKWEEIIVNRSFKPKEVDPNDSLTTYMFDKGLVTKGYANYEECYITTKKGIDVHNQSVFNKIDELKEKVAERSKTWVIYDMAVLRDSLNKILKTVN